MNKINPISFIVRLVLNRANLNDGTLKEQYSTVTRIGAVLACLLGLFSFYGLQRFDPDIDIESEGQIIIENIEIPETQQFETPPPPARPSIPIESEDEDLADDLTIEETDLDNFDAWDAPPPPPSGPQFKFIPYDDPPRPITPIKPVYPDIAQEAGIEGQVLIQCFIDKTGRVKETIVIKGVPNTGLNESAVAALRKTRFRPARQRENPVGVWITIPINFKLQN
ncbi:MAG TPA: energy transducer TonB [Pelagibacterales bacterium]|jgi:protein TonB|nr:energy transducer TonB [Pelagibacterales bacterium]